MDRIPANEPSTPTQSFDELDQLSGRYFSETGQTEAFTNTIVAENSAEAEATNPNVEQYVLSMRQRFLNGLKETAFAVRTYLQGIELKDVRRAGGATLGAAVAITALAACTAEATPTHETKSPSATPSPEKTSNPADKLLTGDALTAAFEIPSGLSDQDLAKAFVDKWSAWNAYGSVEEVNTQINGVFAKGEDPDAAILAIVKDGNGPIASGLFVSGWENVNSLQTTDTSRIEEVDHILTDWYKTHDKSTANQEPYKEWLTIDNSVPISSMKTTTGRILKFVTITNTNADENLVSTTLKADTDPSNGKRVQWTVEFEDDGANEKVANIGQTVL